MCSWEALELEKPLDEVFASYGWEHWGEADLESVMIYLRTSRMVAVPQPFKDLIPKTLSAAAALVQK